MINLYLPKMFFNKLNTITVIAWEQVRATIPKATFIQTVQGECVPPELGLMDTAFHILDRRVIIATFRSR